MIPAEYFPFSSPRYELKIGASPIGPESHLFEVGPLYREELALKRDCMLAAANYYCQTLPGSEIAQAELLEVARCATKLAIPDGGIRAVGDHVQEDLLLLDLSRPGLPLIAGHLCFANAWCLDDKLGRPFMEIHGPVPGFSTSIGPSSEKLIERLKAERPVTRLNWAVKSTGQLDLTNRWDEQVRKWNAIVSSDNAGERCWMRVERQTLSRLPQSNTVLFTVRTYTQPVATLDAGHQSLLLGVLQSCPEAMLRYKGIWPFLTPLLGYLSSR